ncbi:MULTISPECIES: tetratricopeptide repeat protein [Corallococcus]|uniref:tetratricopeptide repeat protein n=1 Tax=Corallococcus TaxID=83461 RepID=UPI00117DF312|nr:MULTISPECIES: tetratricopeptide repeat protein [Corallococcus]NBD07904.1 tetratricopeptide repeat protein [Corallococcus silvisoli]TSC33885.1 tetratricopeptide repeat protein [Corallococcus sp. Z5C101001]
MHALVLALFFAFQAPELKQPPRYSAELEAVRQQADAALDPTGGNPIEARQHIQRLLKEAPENPQTHFLLGRMLVQHGEYEEAHRAMERALELGLDGNDRIEAQNWRDSLQRQMAAFDEAQSAMSEQLRKDPNDLEAHKALALFAYRKRDLAAARTHAARVTELRPDDGDGHALLGAILLDLGDEDGAREQARQARAIGDSNQVQSLEARLQSLSQKRLFVAVPLGLVAVLVLGLGGYWMSRRRNRRASSAGAA